MRLAPHQIPPWALRSFGAVSLSLDHPKIVFGLAAALCERNDVIDLMRSRVELLSRGGHPLRDYAAPHFSPRSPLPAGTPEVHQYANNSGDDGRGRLKLRNRQKNPVDHASRHDRLHQVAQVVEEVLPAAPKAQTKDQHQCEQHTKRHELVVVKRNFVHQIILSNRRSVLP